MALQIFLWGVSRKLLSLGMYPDVRLKDARLRRDEARHGKSAPSPRRSLIVIRSFEGSLGFWGGGRAVAHLGDNCTNGRQCQCRFSDPSGICEPANCTSRRACV